MGGADVGPVIPRAPLPPPTLYCHARTLNLGESASSGTGTWISTLLAVDRVLNWALALMRYSMRVLE